MEAGPSAACSITWPGRSVLYAASLDEALPDGRSGAPLRGGLPAPRRGRPRGRAIAAGDESIVYAGLYGVLQTPEEVVALVLTIEGELLAQLS